MLETQYTTERILRERETACVWLLRERETGRRMVFRRYEGDGSVYRKLVETDCPNLPHVMAVEEENGQVLVLEEYIQGDSLEALLKGCPMTPKEAARIAVQLCGALEVLHGLGAVHRDIKPSNIILREDQAVLIDFDAARIHKEDQSSDTRVMGTTGYAAPEQYGFGQTDARTDIYAMGVLLNVMVTGKHPSQELAEGRLRQIIETCIQVHADRRYPSAEALAAALKKKRRRLWPWLTAAAVLAATLLLWPKATEMPQPEPEPPAEQVAPAEPEIEEAPEPEIGEVPEIEEAPEPEPDPRQQALDEAILQTWTEPYPYRTEFRYDLDGDGTAEPYVFSPCVYGFPDRSLEWDTVSREPTDDSVGIRTVAPGVWRMTSDGRMEQVPAFADLLEEPETLVYCLERGGEGTPMVEPADAVEGIWQGAASMYQHRDAAGKWLFRVTAQLGDQKLEGHLISEIKVVEFME